MEDLFSKFERLRDERNSLVVLGLDPKEFMHFGVVDQILDNFEENTDSSQKIKELIIGVKPNLAFYQGRGRWDYLEDLGRNSDLLRIIDAKLADGTNTNAAAIKSYAPFFDSVTLNTPDVEGTVAVGREKRMDSIIMGAMSFPSTVKDLEDDFGLEFLKKRIDRGINVGAQGIVMGATSYIPSDKIGETIDKLVEKIQLGDKEYLSIHDLSSEQLYRAIERRNNLFTYGVERMRENPKLVALVPGFGRQGGNLEQFLDSGIDINRCMINAGSEILKADSPYEALVEFNQRINGHR